MKKLDAIKERLFFLAQDSPSFARAKIVSVLVDGTRIISYGYNQPKTHPLQRKYASNPKSIYLHSEIDAIRNGIRRQNNEIKGLTLITIRVKKERGDYVLGMAHPCAGCQRAIIDYELKSYYSLDHQQDKDFN